MKYKLIPKQIKEGVVTAVHDGDSIKVVFPDETVWVRLYGCDAPEVVSNHVTAAQPGGKLAGDFLRNTVKGKKVVVETLFKDQYQRMICKVKLNGVDLTENLIEQGWAWWLKEPSMDAKLSNRLKELHNKAKSSRIGLWGLAGRKVKPETWRKNNRRFSMEKEFEDLW